MEVGWISTHQLKTRDDSATFLSFWLGDALCETSPPLLTYLYFTTCTKSGQTPPPGRRPSSFLQAVHILCLDRSNSETPKTATTILQGLPLPFSPSHSTNLSLPTTLAPRATWGRFYWIQNPKYMVGKGSACSSNSGGGGSAPVPEPHVLKTNLFKTCLTSPHHPLATESDSIL